MEDNKELKELLSTWRHNLHAHPETAFEEVKTAAFVAEKLRSMGIEVEEGIGGTGVVGTLKAGNGKKILGETRSFSTEMQNLIETRMEELARVCLPE